MFNLDFVFFYHEFCNVIRQHLVHSVQKFHVQSPELSEIHRSLEISFSHFLQQVSNIFFTGSPSSVNTVKVSTVQSHQDFLHLCNVREVSWADLVLTLQL